MNIHDFESYLPTILVNRGYNYFLEDRVTLSQLDCTQCTAEVEGTETYEVTIDMDEKGNILNTNCDCPYDYDNECKHIAATLFAIASEAPTNKKSAASLDELLQEKSKKQLQELLFDVAAQYPVVKKYLKMKLTPSIDALENAKDLIDYHIEEATKKGFVKWNQVGKALSGVYQVSDQATAAFDDEKYQFAIQLNIICIKAVVDLESYCDDSSGEVGGAVDDAIRNIYYAIKDGVEVWSTSEKQQVYKQIVKIAMHENLEGWSSWRANLLRTLVPLCEDMSIHQQFDTLLAEQLQSNEDWNTRYYHQEIRAIQLQLLEVNDDPKIIQQFLQQNLHDNQIREKVVNMALAEYNYQYALELCEEGMRIDQDKRGLVHQWKRYAFMAYEGLNQLEKMREIAYQLVLASDDDFYEKLKSLYASDEWLILRERLLDELEHKSPRLYVNNIVAEGLTERLLGYCQAHPAYITTYYAELIPTYQTEVEQIFYAFIEEKAVHSSNRSHYREFCRDLRIMQRAGYHESVNRLIKSLQARYPRRTAMLDEFSKI
ncbi:SWIM zinc finger family protein [Viridibacillus sp. YIM B01967]|uniref:SWIM zinc finger family protein n=1 Tax=Viridibacillus soli TaxID=2798301 RepID=A0ABS1H781_9BACL|nr:SWIM zinc finger family protein [Viridibacillus soli]MBK3495278.1 SWIM zinc finger family protein [Viridibacillus soli]